MQHHCCIAVNAWDLHDFFVFQARFNCPRDAQGKGSHLTATRVISAALSGGSAGFFASPGDGDGESQEEVESKGASAIEGKACGAESQGAVASVRDRADDAAD